MRITTIDGVRYVQVDDLAAAKGVTRSGIHAAIKAGRITGPKFWGVTFVPLAQAKAFEKNRGGRREGAGRKKAQPEPAEPTGSGRE